ncbi:MAG: 5'/3'-nucleotidase SurE, partial [Phycisphaerales bacterium]
MRILLTNDDGIRAPGIRAMHDALIDLEGRHDGPLGDVFTVAPATVQSATSHGVTFHEPLMVAETRIHDAMRGVAVDGRPADCVKLALSNIWTERHGENARPDLVVSGMNAGANVGINVIYSGTVAAALEAAFLGVPSIAVSLHLGRGRPRFDIAARWARAAIERVIEEGLPSPHECININIPRVQEPEESGKTGDPIADRKSTR